MAVIETTSGGVTTRNAGTLDVSIFYRKNVRSAEQVLYEAERDKANEISSIGSAEVIPSGRAATQKKWVTKRNEFVDGSYLRIEIRKTGLAIGVFGRTRNIIIRPRAGAALWELRIDCPTDENSITSAVYTIGQFDILSLKEIKELGFHLNPNGRNNIATYEEPKDLDDLTIIMKEKETAKRQLLKTQVLDTPKGKRIVPKLIVKRRINLP